ncbi:flavin reductase family protein [Marinicella litoralis]|uniref:Flavin reductase (DIM6/NTAB) family NADH-FMN oxidoreductase RutF n=1 Tax=Marinicella litoralis TaxID=644220 RepID=A0A4R6XLU0_9GAMM|nr:flavin reductase [Marinicella litoralis]TDR20605.1 flavin reductase (DIM6/NTAB) family NADH-FMN oxidoreductase RutF [Marinicella litoralis]
MLITQDKLQAFDRIKRLNLINSITGIKPANLIGTQNLKQQSNLALFSSVVHLGSDPAILGFITRPSEEVPRHTLENILTTKHYTINHVPTSMVQQAHQTAAKYPAAQSEFSACGFSEQIINHFPAPFVEQAQIKIGLKLAEILPIAINQTQMVIGVIEIMELADELLSTEGYIDLQRAQSAGVSGLNNYYGLQSIQSFPYPRV